MKTYLKILIPVGTLCILSAVFYSPYKRWASEHVNYITAVDDHPLKCGSCHLHMQKSGIISKIVNARYYSPFNLAVSKDGRNLYVVAEEGNALLVINTDKQKVTDKIEVGTRPHSVILSEDGRTAYVTNKWSDNVTVDDIKRKKKIKTNKTE